METITLNDIDTSTKEGQLLIAALAQLTVTEEHSKRTPYEMLDYVNQIRLGIYEENSIY